MRSLRLIVIGSLLFCGVAWGMPPADESPVRKIGENQYAIDGSVTVGGTRLQNEALMDWVVDEMLLCSTGGDTFGNIWYDPDNSIYRMWVHSDSGVTTGKVYQYQAKSPHGLFYNRTLAIDHGSANAWDDDQTGVPFAWYEAGEARPWRMLYRGANWDGGGDWADLGAHIGLVTSTDGVTWVRQDIEGNVLSEPVLQQGDIGEWDNGNIDFSGVIQVDGVYYLYYNTVNTNRRQMGVATSTDLVNWYKHPNNPLFTGISGYVDKTGSVGSVADEYGFFCPDIVRWDDNGSPRFVLVTPHYRANHTQPYFDLYVSKSPVFTEENRYYVGKFFDPIGESLTRQGLDGNGDPCKISSSGVDTPAFITDTIERNITTSSQTDPNIYVVASTYSSGTPSGSCGGWNHQIIHKDPGLRTSMSADDNTAGLWLPGIKGDFYDYSGNGNHLSSSRLNSRFTDIDTDGVDFESSSDDWLAVEANSSGVIDAIDSITGDFTIEAKVNLESAFTSGYRGIFYYGQDATTPYHFYFLLEARGGGDYRFAFFMTDDGNKSAISDEFTLTTDTDYRVAISRTSGTIYFFLNGSAQGSVSFPYAPDYSATKEAKVGCNYADNDAFWDGHIDEIRVSNIGRYTTAYTPIQMR